jgi:hypothetical protein
MKEMCLQQVSYVDSVDMLCRCCIVQLAVGVQESAHYYPAVCSAGNQLRMGMEWPASYGAAHGLLSGMATAVCLPHEL